MNINPDPYTETLRAQYAHEYFVEASRPIIGLMAEVSAIHQRIRILIRPDGTNDVQISLPPEAESQMTELKKLIAQCRELAETEAQRMFP